MTSKIILEITIIIAVLVASAAFGGSAMADTACTPSTTTLCLIIEKTSNNRSTDDAEERKSSGRMVLNSNDMDLSERYIVGLRFNDISISPGTIITSAHIELTSEDRDKGSDANTRIQAQNSDNAPTFTKYKFNISDRLLTTASVDWTNIPDWSNNEVGSDTQTPDITSLVQEVIDRHSWSSGNSMVFVFSELLPIGSDRDAYSFEHKKNYDRDKQARLHIVCAADCNTTPDPAPDPAPDPDPIALALNDLTDVTISAPTNGEVLTYVENGQWLNQTPVQGPQGDPGPSGLPCNGCVNSASLADNAVITAKIQDNAVTADKIASNAVTNSKLADGAVNSAELANNAVITAKIQNDAVTADKIASNAVTFAKLSLGLQGQLLNIGFSDSNENDFLSNVSNEYSIRVPGGARIASNSFATAGVILAPDSNAWASISDVRLKENIQDYSVLDKLADYRTVEFDWKNNGNHDVAVIAQELYQIFPETVNVGSTQGDITGMMDSGTWSVQYSKLGALALQAITEQQILIDEQNKQMDEQKELIDSLIEILCESNADYAICEN